MKSCSYWAAGHITAFFKIADAVDDILHKGSRGVGFNIKRGVITDVSHSSSVGNRIFFNNHLQDLQTSGITNFVITEIQELLEEKIPFLDIKHTFQIPIGAGYGSSASSALSTAFAVNSFLELGIPDLKLWQIAHKSEISNKTGLGDILGMFSQSSFEMRTKEGAPGIGNVDSLEFDVSNYNLFTYSLGPLSKKFLLSDPSKRALIMKSGQTALETFQEDPSFEKFCQISQSFTQAVDLLPKNLQIILNSIPPTIKGSQIMLGESLFFFVPKNKNYTDYIDLQLIKEELVRTTIKRVNDS